MLNQPGDQLDLGAIQAQSLTGLAGGARAGDLLPARPALAGIVQEHGQEQRLAIDNQRHDRRGQRMIVGQAPAGDVGDHADRPQGVLIDRVGVVHVELHLGHDPPELRQIASQHASLIHQPERALRITASGQDVQEHLGGGPVTADR